MATDATPVAFAAAGAPDSDAPAVARVNAADRPLTSGSLESTVIDVELAENQTAAHDKFAHTRNRRKRTSREDHAVLESEYQRNARPDKATRASIVQRVSLSEKEVQIWFQNRRQMTRRKCRTWQPNEITSIIRSSHDPNTDAVDALSFSEANDLRFSQSFTSEMSFVRENPQLHNSPPSSQESATADSTNGQQSQSSQETWQSSGTARESGPSQLTLSQGSEVPTSTNTHSIPKTSETPDSESQDSSGPSSTTASLSKAGENSVSGLVGSGIRRSGLKRKASAARLSTSIDGKAEVVLGNDSPSPFKKQSTSLERAHRSGGLQRSQSAASPQAGVDYMLGLDVPEWRKSKPHGRSRDARAWEFYCDSDARNALTKTAELDKHGSAQGVLGLIRSSSGSRKPLNPLSRENIPLQGLDDKHGKTVTGRRRRAAKLERAMSSMARLQSPGGLKPKVDANSNKNTEKWQDNFGDSDKENQDPDGRNLRRSVSHSSEVPRDLGKSGDIEEHGDGAEHTNLAGKVVAGSADVELDVVQQLLSLSKGAWQ